MPLHRGIHGWKWTECDSCGFPWPKHQLRRDYTGKLACPRCYDKPGFEENLRSTSIKIEDTTAENDYEDIL